MKNNIQIQSITQMTEIVLPGIVAASALQIKESSVPAPRFGEVLVQVEASGVAFAEQAMRRGRYPGQPPFPFVPGYDMVGIVIDVGPGVTPDFLGKRVCAVTKIGGWASHVLVKATVVVPAPASVDPALIEAVLLNGVTAWQMMFRKANVKAGQTILVHGANGGVGSILVQLARHMGISVIGTASPRHHEALRQLGVQPVDYNAQDLAGQIRALAPKGVDAAFDHLGLASARMSFGLLAPGGAVISYGNATILNGTGPVLGIYLQLFANLKLWNLLPNSRRATFYNIYGGSGLNPKAFQARFAQDLTAILDLLARGAIHPQIAARFPLSEASAAMTLAESRTVHGKIVLIP